MKFGILVFPGGHGVSDLTHTIEEVFHGEVTRLWYADPDPWKIDTLLIPGGFPCTGAQNGFDCLRDTPAMERMQEFAGKGGLVIGFGNGFQLLCESGLLPGRLTANKNGKFICRHIFVKPDNVHMKLTNGLKPDKPYRLPMATYIGRFEADEDRLVHLRQADEIIFRYCDYAGRISDSVNITGSIDNIAGICNRNRNVMGMIPQPERAAFNIAGNDDGKWILNALFSGLL